MIFQFNPKFHLATNIRSLKLLIYSENWTANKYIKEILLVVKVQESNKNNLLLCEKVEVFYYIHLIKKDLNSKNAFGMAHALTLDKIYL